MKLSCCSWSYHRTMQARRLTFAQWLTLCAEELRVGGVDIIAEQMPARTRAYWRATKKRCTDLQLTIVSLSPGNNFGAASAAARRREVANVQRWIEAAVVMGAPLLRIFAGWPPEGRAQALWPAMVRCIRQAAKTAAQAGVTLAVEPHNAGGFLPDSRATLQLIRELGSPWVRINLDTGNYHEPDPYAGMAASLPYAPHVVAKVHPEPLDYGKIFAMLARRHYRGFVTLEYEGAREERRGVPAAIAMLRRYGRRYGL